MELLLERKLNIIKLLFAMDVVILFAIDLVIRTPKLGKPRIK